MSEETEELDAYASRRARQVAALKLSDLESVADIILGTLHVCADLSEFAHPDPLDYTIEIMIRMGGLRANSRLFEEREELVVALETWFAGVSPISASEASGYGLVVDDLHPHDDIELESWHDAVLQHGRLVSNWGRTEQGQWNATELEHLPRLEKRPLEVLLKRELAAARRAAIAAGIGHGERVTPKVNLPPAERYLGIELGEREARRDGFNGVVKFGHKLQPWKLFKRLVELGSAGESKANLQKELGIEGKDESALRGHKSTVNNLVMESLRIEINPNGKGVWTLVSLDR